jgi:hypothetical protein
LLLVVLLFTILVRFFCRFRYWLPVLAGTQQSRTHDTCAEESVAMTVTTTTAAAGARHFPQRKACLFCRQTSFETLKPAKKTLKMAFRV